ncbi:Uncharacterised protein [Mycobacteroides abscessus subsp. abscessus]|nr:Uncharacterised protein [Mycobacteroides abscessus subsp. abscessus]
MISSQGGAPVVASTVVTSSPATHASAQRMLQRLARSRFRSSFSRLSDIARIRAASSSPRSLTFVAKRRSSCSQPPCTAARRGGWGVMFTLCPKIQHPPRPNSDETNPPGVSTHARPRRIEEEKVTAVPADWPGSPARVMSRARVSRCCR